MDKVLYFPDIVQATGVSERTIKFWMQEYRLAVGKEGRNTTFPAATVADIALIRDLVATKLVTSRLIAIILETRRGRAPAAEDNLALQRLAELWLTAAPRAAATMRLARAQAGRPAQSGGGQPPRPSSPDGVL